MTGVAWKVFLKIHLLDGNRARTYHFTMASVDRRVGEILQTVNRVVLGKDAAVRLALSCLLARGHLLLEDLPGVGKTTLALALAHTLGLHFGRIQFTSDLLPTDIVGVSVLNLKEGALEFRPGPIFHQIVLADEINRATPKTQSALLEAMAEGQVSVEGETRSLPRPFFVIATQNPVEHYGTFPLPESQMDRFMMVINMGYPDRRAERELLESLDIRRRIDRMSPLLGDEEILRLQDRVDEVRVASHLLEYVLDLAASSRASERLLIGISPRGSECWVKAAKAWAFIHNRDYCLPEDIQAVAGPVVAHRVLPRTEYEKVDRDTLVGELIRGIPVR
jgi:MoxR-like ATPase